MTHLIVGLVALILGELRVVGLTHIAFQAVAHLFMGGLAVVAWTTKDRAYWWMFVVLCVVEVASFMVFQFLA